MPRRGWEIPDREATPEDVFLNRRRFFKAAAATGLAAAGLLPACGSDGPVQLEKPLADPELYPARRNPVFSALDRPLTDEPVASGFTNFYEFSVYKDSVLENIGDFTTSPWTVGIGGLVPRARVYDIDTLIRLIPLEERLYRLRCVETWAMAVPWTGFPLKALIDVIQPLSAARYVQFTAFLKPEEAPVQRNEPDSWPWPYTEGLSMAEATSELPLLACGIYGHELPRQHGAPLRLVVPWQYGYKSIKSIVHIAFTAEQPATFWNTLVPQRYGFVSNVDPAGPFQGTESMLGVAGRRATLPHNGYADYVAGLYG